MKRWEKYNNMCLCVRVRVSGLVVRVSFLTSYQIRLLVRTYGSVLSMVTILRWRASRRCWTNTVPLISTEAFCLWDTFTVIPFDKRTAVENNDRPNSAHERIEKWHSDSAVCGSTEWYEETEREWDAEHAESARAQGNGALAANVIPRLKAQWYVWTIR